jgi:antitoxin ParD1/3/4
MTSKPVPVPVTFGEQQSSVDRRLASGEYESASDIVRAGLRALDREDALRDEGMRQKIVSSLADPRPDVAAEDVFERLRAHHGEQVAAGRRKP